MINKVTLINPDTPLPEYMLLINELYKNPEDRSIPVFFAMKVVDLQKQGAPKLAVDRYKNAVKQKLKSSGIIQ